MYRQKHFNGNDHECIFQYFDHFALRGYHYIDITEYRYAQCKVAGNYVLPAEEFQDIDGTIYFRQMVSGSGL